MFADLGHFSYAAIQVTGSEHQFGLIQQKNK